MTTDIYKSIDPFIPPLLQNVVTFNKSEYIYCVVLLNGEGPFLNLTTESVVGLNIVDNITKFTHTGELVVLNDNDIIERAYNNPGESYTTRQADLNTNSIEFFFRGDGRDLVLILITPRDSDNLNLQDQVSLTNPFTLKFLFSITNIRDQITSSGKKLKVLTLQDLDERILEEVNLNFCTSKFVEGKNLTNLDNSERGILSGEVVRNLLTSALTQSGTFKDNTEISFATNDAWDSGGSTLFYSSPATYNAYNDLIYVLQRHISGQTFDSCILRKERNNVWSLMSVGNYFKYGYNKGTDSAGALHIEKFLVQSSGSTVNVVLKKDRTPTALVNNTGYLNSSYITNYQLYYSDAQTVQDDIITHAVHSYQLNDKQFNIDMTRNNIESAKRTFEDFYVKPMKGENGRPAPFFYTNAIRNSNRNIKNTFSLADYSLDQRLNWGRNYILLNAIYRGLTIEFTVDGISNRQAGRFISIDREDALPTSSFDDRLLGIWFIVNVEHTFTSTTYQTKIIAVKTYSYSPVGGNPDIQ